MKYTDIQLKDKSTWRSYKQQWADNNFQVVTDTELEGKKLNAAMLNGVTSNITSLQGDLLTGAKALKANKIPCQEDEPALRIGQVWFAIYDPEEMGNYIKFTSKDGEFSISTNWGWDGAVDCNRTPWLPNKWAAWDGSSVTAKQNPDTDEYTILFRGYRNSIITGDDENNAWKITADSSVKVECYGNMENMLDYTVVKQGGHPTMGDYAFAHMFKGCTQLVTVPELPFMTLSDSCYYNMFNGCTNLRTAPKLPSIALANNCYRYMFGDCTSLTTPPELPATTLKSGCYTRMFTGCTGLGTAPELPATILAQNCYASMFASCKQLVQPPALPATTLALGCYSGMFFGCSSLKSAPELNALRLFPSSYSSMFWGCSSLTEAPKLPATALQDRCYGTMFRYCTSLTMPPELPATTLYEDCYERMFDGCTGITSAPSLPAMTLANNCYYGMFGNCLNLKTPPELPATTLASACYSGMFKGCVGLKTIPELPSTTLIDGCYQNMFDGCTSIKLSETQTSGYSTPYRIPSSGTGLDATNALTDMFANTGGTFTGTPTINTTYYMQTSYIRFSTETPGDLTINVKNPGWDGTLEYSMDGEEWIEWDGSNITSANDSIYFRGSNNSVITGYPSRSSTWNIFGDRVSCTGNIETLLDYEVVETGEHPSMGSYCYDSMFSGCTDLIEAPSLPATELTSYCYFEMFHGCTSLITAPELPAVDDVGGFCYYGMFGNCTSLTSAPELPATTVYYNAYDSMFAGCTSLVTAPSLPATAIDKYCYFRMFEGCINLTSIPSLPAIKMVNSCYERMFNGCSKIKLSKTQDGEYTQVYRIPASGTGQDTSSWDFRMFYATGGTFTEAPEINTTYYLSSSNTIV